MSRDRLDEMRPQSGRITAALVGATALLLAATPYAAAAGRVTGTSGDDALEGTPHRDWIRAFHGDDVLVGHGGNDVLDPGPGDDESYGGPGNDDIQDSRGRDVLVGGTGDDSLDGSTGIDMLVGGPGRDYLADYLGGDLLRAGAGDDRAGVASRGSRPYPPTRLHLGRGDDEVLLAPDGRRDLIDCGPGRDLVEWDQSLDEEDELVDCEVVREYTGY
jgi:hypothetical protein